MFADFWRAIALVCTLAALVVLIAWPIAEFHPDARWIVLGLLALAAALALIRSPLAGWRRAAPWGLACVALAMAGCSPLSALTGAPGQTSNAEVLRALGEHIDGCDRRYQGGLGVGASFTFNIDCKATRVAPAGGAAPAVAPPDGDPPT